MNVPGRFGVTYDAALAEEAVLRAEGLMDASRRAAFHFERDRLYEVPDVEEREARFEELHGRWFVALGLDRPLHQAMAEQPLLVLRAGACRVLPAPSRKEELADLFGAPVADVRSAPTIVVRLRAESLLDPSFLLAHLRHELAHVADMLDPEFAYERELPAREGSPAADALLRERYHAVWDVTIDGRLFRRGLLTATARHARLPAFARAFPATDGDASEPFRRWFDEPRPTHAAILGYAASAADAERCPLCRFPVAKLGPSGICARCAEMCEAQGHG